MEVLCRECRGNGTLNDGVNYTTCWRCMGLGFDTVMNKEREDERR